LFLETFAVEEGVMALLNETYLRSLAKARSSRFYESTDSLLRKRAMDSAPLSSFDIFLSHSYLDKELSRLGPFQLEKRRQRAALEVVLGQLTGDVPSSNARYKSTKCQTALENAEDRAEQCRALPG
jgi:hypothetical protein